MSCLLETDIFFNNLSIIYQDILETKSSIKHRNLEMSFDKQYGYIIGFCLMEEGFCEARVRNNYCTVIFQIGVFSQKCP